MRQFEPFWFRRLQRGHIRNRVCPMVSIDGLVQKRKLSILSKLKKIKEIDFSFFYKKKKNHNII